MALTDTALRAVKPTEKQQKLFDGKGLFLLVSPTGAKGWRLKYHFQGREKLISLGQYPLVSLKEARERATAARKMLDNGFDPSTQRKLERDAYQNTFELVALEWHEQQTAKWDEKNSKMILSRLKRYLFPVIGSQPVNSISAPALLSILRKIESKGTRAIAPRVLSMCSSIFRYAIATGRAERDPAADLRGALKPYARHHLASQTTPESVGILMNAVYNYPGTLVVRCALQLMALTFCRTGEIRGAEWREIDFEEKLWRIPAERMKMKRDHLVPLSTQAIAILETLRPYSGTCQYLFPNSWTETRPISKSTLLEAIRRLGFTKDEMCPHGFRSMASTLLNELGYNGDWIERQLAHVPHNIIRGIYNRAEYYPERRKMLQDWADYLDTLREKMREERRKV